MVVSDIYLSKPVSWPRLIARVVHGREGRFWDFDLTLPALPETHSHSLPQLLAHAHSLPLLGVCGQVFSSEPCLVSFLIPIYCERPLRLKDVAIQIPIEERYRPRAAPGTCTNDNILITLHSSLVAWGPTVGKHNC